METTRTLKNLLFCFTTAQLKSLRVESKNKNYCSICSCKKKIVVAVPSPYLSCQFFNIGVIYLFCSRNFFAKYTNDSVLFVCFSCQTPRSAYFYEFPPNGKYIYFKFLFHFMLELLRQLSF